MAEAPKERYPELPLPPVKVTHEVDRRGARYAVPAHEYYLTTHEVAARLRAHPETIWRWCKKWFGELPPGRAGREMGYRLPPIYLKVARVWQLTTDPAVREYARKVLVDGESDPNFLVLVADEGETCHTWDQAVEAATRLLEAGKTKESRNSTVFIFDLENIQLYPGESND